MHEVLRDCVFRPVAVSGQHSVGGVSQGALSTKQVAGGPGPWKEGRAATPHLSS